VSIGCQEEIAATAHKNDIAACHDFGVSIAHSKNDLEDLKAGWISL